MPIYTFDNISKLKYFVRRQTSTNPFGSITLYYNDTVKNVNKAVSDGSTDLLRRK